MSKLEEHDFPLETFIGGYYIPEEICDGLVDYYKDNKIDCTPGSILVNDGRFVDPSIKDSTDLPVNPHESNARISAYLSALGQALFEYQKKYTELNRLSRYTLTNNWNIQHYKAGGGYKDWHCERAQNNNRLLAWMTYLNDVPDGGTEFMYQKITTPAKKGLTLFWPTDWTHTHRGQISSDHEKYIATGWMNFIDD